MSLSYRVWTEEEDKTRGTIEKGTYPFKVSKIEQKQTKSGAYQMLEVELEIPYQGRSFKLRDWIVLMDDMGWKLRHFAATCGLLDKYEMGTLHPRDFLDKEGIVKVTVGEAKDKNGEKTGQLRNNVVDYEKPLGGAKSDEPPFFDDDIPNM